MSEFSTIIDPSVHSVQEQLQPLAKTHRLTVICGLVVPAHNSLVLVQTKKSAHSGEHADDGLKPPQGGIEDGEAAVGTFFREVTEEVGVAPDQIDRVVGITFDPPMAGGRTRGGKDKAFGVLCGVVRAECLPPLSWDPTEISLAGWYPAGRANELFRGQITAPKTGEKSKTNEHLHARGERSQRVLHAIAALGFLEIPAA